jgi:hypothetical protein
MKSLKIILAISAILLVSVSCNAQFRTVRGNHKVVSEERKTGSFTGIRVSTGIDVFLKQGNDESVNIEADENLHEYIITEVKNGFLNIYTDANIRDAESKKVYITMKEINSIVTTSAGDVFGETPIHTDNLKLEASSAGNIKLEVTASKISVDIHSSGDITISGEAEVLQGDLSSAGDLNAFNLVVKEADISASSAGDANINVTEKLKARASSAGDVNYMGNPKFIDVHASSAGDVHKK